MLTVLRLLASLVLMLVGFSLINLALAVKEMSLAWSGGAYTAENSLDYFLVLVAYGVCGAFATLFGLLGLLATARRRGNPAGGKVLTIVAAIGFVLSIAAAAAVILSQSDPGSQTYLTLILSASAVAVVALLATLFGRARPAAT